jgi:predicted GNAT family N-acyltransferase
MRIIQPATAEDFENYYRLRWEVLRKPWNQPRGTEKDEQEDIAFHAMAVNEQGECVGVARLQHNSPDEAQVRFMGVRHDQQGKGTGRALMHFLEGKAKSDGIRKIVLQARENAVPFYRALGYSVTEKTFRLWDIIQHYKMEKTL